MNREVREEYALEHTLFSLRGNVILADFRQVRELTRRFNAKIDPAAQPERVIKAGQFNAMGLIDEILHYMAALYRAQVRGDAFDTALVRLENTLGPDKSAALLRAFSEQFPPQAVYAGKTTVETYLGGAEAGESCRSLSVEELLLLALANLNPAFTPFKFLFDDRDLAEKTVYTQAIAELRAHFAELPPFGPDGLSLWDLLRAPALASPDSLAGQLEFMRSRWGLLLGKFMARLLTGLDVIKEEEKPSFFGPGPTEAYTYGALDNEYERFSPDQDWMPRTVLMAKSTLVWLYQLSKKYGRSIERLDQIPDEELDGLARRGFTGLWLIGLWERSNASRTVKQWTGNPEAAASAYSLYDYDIAGELGGWGSLVNLRERCARRGIRLGSDMVPNHTGIDSRWVMEHPDRFLQLRYPPFPAYTFNGGNLSNREGVGVYIEDHYYNRSDAAVVFKRVDFNTGDVRYIYHGNDGTSMPWNDTAQIDFLNPEAREAVIRTIVGVCKQFSIVRFDAAMTLAKRHIQRLWYPEPGHGGDIASRAEQAVSAEEFNRRIPNEFWREVVDRCAEEAPNTLLLAEAFWMMEGYFVRTLGMHRVYNSAFMNMLKNEENAKYRATIKNTLEFDPEILKRFVNFMNNPDEETAAAQFGKGDKYFGICTLLVTMPGLPMFGHGQIEGFEEKYGMEYRRSYRNESPDPYLVDRHEREIFPLMKKRAVFSGSAAFRLYDLFTADGGVNENVFAYSNRDWDDRSLVLYNNSYYAASGWIRQSSPAIPQGDGSLRQDTLSEALSIHGDGRYFTLFREQRSGLWYIRSSKEISEQGLFVSLNGYEAQVFLDIHEAADFNGRWARLNHELSGRGVPDLQAAIRDLFLGELYRPFTALFKEESYRDLDALKEPILAFIAVAREYISGANGRYDPFNTGRDHPPLDPEKIREEFAAFFDRWALIAGYAEPVPSGLGKDTVRFLKKIREKLRAKPYVAAFAVAYGVVALLRSIIGEGASGADAAALMDHWQLDRKLRECFDTREIPGDEAYRVIELIRGVLSRTSPEDVGPYQIPPLGAALVLANYRSEDFRKLLGVNLFEDTVWFNKEAFEAALFYAPLFLALEGDAALEAVRRPNPAGKRPKAVPEAPGTTESRWLIRLERIAELTDQFDRAEKDSGYTLERLIELLSETAGEPMSAGGGLAAAAKGRARKKTPKPAKKP
ncbi:MAG: alpha-amylase [Spirochaetaceae bacterium]|nr:alpha-amylase [Spirochaetaceae bacterium]